MAQPKEMIVISNRIALLGASYLFLTVACAHNHQSSKKDQTAKLAHSTEKAFPKRNTEIRPDRKALLELAVRLAKPESAVTEADLLVLAQIPLSEINSFEATAIIVSQSKKISNREESLSLEEILSPYKIDLAMEIQKNIALRNVETYSLISKALAVSSDSIEFKAQISGIITTEAEKWSRLLPSEDLVEEDSVEPEDSSQTKLPSLTDLHQGDHLLMEAENLAEKGHYLKAIEKIRAIPPESPMWESSQKKIKRYSDQAVSQLRQKAAQAFQNASPRSHKTARAIHLLAAKKYLEQAAKNFPEASQIAKVKENLTTIAKDLEKYQLDDAPEEASVSTDETKPQLPE